jgi:hypothetical protein
MAGTVAAAVGAKAAVVRKSPATSKLVAEICASAYGVFALP